MREITFFLASTFFPSMTPLRITRLSTWRRRWRWFCFCNSNFHSTFSLSSCMYFETSQSPLLLRLLVSIYSARWMHCFPKSGLLIICVVIFQSMRLSFQISWGHPQYLHEVAGRSYELLLSSPSECEFSPIFRPFWSQPLSLITNHLYWWVRLMPVKWRPFLSPLCYYPTLWCDILRIFTTVLSLICP